MDGPIVLQLYLQIIVEFLDDTTEQGREERRPTSKLWTDVGKVVFTLINKNILNVLKIYLGSKQEHLRVCIYNNECNNGEPYFNNENNKN